MGFRWRMALGAVASLVLVASCGGGEATSRDPAASKVSLPLQSSGLAVGGDVQSRATDVLERGITEEQAAAIAEACGDAAEIANDGAERCLQIVRQVFEGSNRSCAGTLTHCLSAFDVSSISNLSYDGYVEITDQRTDGSECGAVQGNVCFRLGVATSALLSRVVTNTSTSTSSEVTPSTQTESTAPTSTTAGSPDTSASTPEGTSAPTASS